MTYIFNFRGNFELKFDNLFNIGTESKKLIVLGRTGIRQYASYKTKNNLTLEDDIVCLE